MENRQPSDDIFWIIHSLNKEESGYFVQYINSSGMEHKEFYILFFKLIKKQETYNEEEIKKRLYHPTLVGRFPKYKNKLYLLLLESMAAYRCSASVDCQIHQLLENIRFLREKQLYAQALKYVDKAKELAKKYEKISALHDIYDLERKLLKNSAQVNLVQSLEEIYGDNTTLLKKTENEDRIGYINDKIFAIYRELHKVRTPEKEKELEQLMQDPLLSSESNALTFRTKLKFNYLHAEYHQLYGNYKKAFEYYKRIIELYDQYPHMKAEDLIRYRSDLGNLISVGITSYSSFDFEGNISKLESISGGSMEDNASFFNEIYFSRQIYLLNSRQFEQALKFIPGIEKGLIRFDKQLNPTRKLSFLYNIAITYFINELYAQALDTFERIISANRLHEVRTDLRDISGIFRIILLYQTGKHDLAGYEIHNTRQRLKNNNKLYELEQVVLQYIPLLIAAKKGSPEETKAFNDFLTQAEQLFAKPENKNMLGIEEMVIWGRGRVGSRQGQ